MNGMIAGSGSETNGYCDACGWDCDCAAEQYDREMGFGDYAEPYTVGFDDVVGAFFKYDEAGRRVARKEIDEGAEWQAMVDAGAVVDVGESVQVGLRTLRGDGAAAAVAGDYSQGGCWLQYVEPAGRAKLAAELGVVPAAPVGYIALACRIYGQAEVTLEASRVHGDLYHLSPGKSRLRCGLDAWRKAWEEGSGHLYGHGRRPLFGMPYRHLPLEAVRLERVVWLNLAELQFAFRLAMSEPFSKQAHRDAVLAQLQRAQEFGVYSLDERFPPRGAYACTTMAAWDRVIQQLMLAAEYKDRAKDIKAKRGFEEKGEDREEDYPDSLVAFGKGMANAMRLSASGAGVFDREHFEANFGLTWDGTNDSVRLRYNHFGPVAVGHAYMPWVSVPKLMELLKVAIRLNPRLAEHRFRVGAIIYHALAVTPPLAKGRVMSNEGEWVSLAYGDWSNKFAQLFLVIGAPDGGKDDKYKAGQTLSSDSHRNDMNDVAVTYQNAIRRIQSQLAAGDGVFNKRTLERLLGVQPKVAPTPGPPDGRQGLEGEDDGDTDDGDDDDDDAPGDVKVSAFPVRRDSAGDFGYWQDDDDAGATAAQGAKFLSRTAAGRGKVLTEYAKTVLGKGKKKEVAAQALGGDVTGDDDDAGDGNDGRGGQVDTDVD